jgi:hypothetical protein
MTDVTDDLIVPLKWSIERDKQKKLIEALTAENALLRSKLRGEPRAESIAFFKQQIGPTS